MVDQLSTNCVELGKPPRIKAINVWYTAQVHGACQKFSFSLRGLVDRSHPSLLWLVSNRPASFRSHRGEEGFGDVREIAEPTWLHV